MRMGGRVRRRCVTAAVYRAAGDVALAVEQYEDDVPDDVKNTRQEELQELQRMISEERLARYVGRQVDVLVDQVTDPDEDGITPVGRVVWQADDVDGVTRLRNGGWAKPGTFVRAHIDDNRDYDFDATALADPAGV